VRIVCAPIKDVGNRTSGSICDTHQQGQRWALITFIQACRVLLLSPRAFASWLALGQLEQAAAVLSGQIVKL
jgi:hypothetical protein